MRDTFAKIGPGQDDRPTRTRRTGGDRQYAEPAARQFRKAARRGKGGLVRGVMPLTTATGAEKMPPPSVDFTNMISDPAIQTTSTVPSEATEICGEKEKGPSEEPGGCPARPVQVAPLSVVRAKAQTSAFRSSQAT